MTAIKPTIEIKNMTQWQIKLENNIYYFGLKRSDKEVNSISPTVLNELQTALTEVAADHNAKGIIIYSLHKSGFVAGADVDYLKSCQTPEQVREILQLGQTTFNALQNIAIPTVALIDGFCLGGGLELALACRYRVATDSSKTKLGLPEVMLGFHPGWGGTVRLPLLIGVMKALPLMMTGRAVKSGEAKAIGLVDDVVPVRQLMRAGVYFIEKIPAQKQPASWLNVFKFLPTRNLLATLSTNKTKKMVRKEHYPAPYALIDLMVKGPWRGAQSYQDEIDSVVRLITVNDTVTNLFRVYSLRETLKSLGKKATFTGQDVHVIGAGVMGGDIAAWCVLSGYRVTLQDREAQYLTSAIERAARLFKKKLKKPRLVQEAMDRLIPDVEGDGVKRADVIIEAIVEDKTIKQNLFKELEAKAKPTCILATNTSTIPLEDIAVNMKDPSRLVGIHFFNPVPKMPLVEIVIGASTNAAIAELAASFVKTIDKLPLPVKSSPGFLVNRVLMPYLMECMKLLEEGVPAEVIDKAALKFGMPLGPVELADTVGLDICLHAAKNLTAIYGGHIPDQLVNMVARGELGKKTGKGFYAYQQGKKVTDTKTPSNTTATTNSTPAKMDDTVIADRLVAALIKEAKACLKEGIVVSADLVDAGMIFGAGFAPFRGGPLNYSDSMQIANNPVTSGTPKKSVSQKVPQKEGEVENE